jgi:putative nucleotide binding protein
MRGTSMYATTRKFEEVAYVLDFLVQGHLGERAFTHQMEQLIQAVGEQYFTLLELVPRRGAQFAARERIAIGKEGNQKIDHVRGRVRYDDLTSIAKNELPIVIENIITAGEERFTRFFNTAGPITTRLHQLQLLPGVGKKTMWEVLDERKKKPFLGFKDLVERVRIQDPTKIIAKRVLMELQNEDKYQIFTWKYKGPQQ